MSSFAGNVERSTSAAVASEISLQSYMTFSSKLFLYI